MKIKIERYGIYFANLNPTLGSEINKIRPVVVISQEEMNLFSDTIVVCPLTSKIHRQWRSRIQILCNGKNAEIAVDQIRTISKIRIKKQIDKLQSNTSIKLRNLIVEMYGE